MLRLFPESQGFEARLRALLVYAGAALLWLAVTYGLLPLRVDDPTALRLLQVLGSALFAFAGGAYLYVALPRGRSLPEDDGASLRFMSPWVSDVLYRLTVHPDRVLGFISASVEGRLGHPGQAFHEDPDLLIRLVHPEDRERVARYFQECEEQAAAFEARWLGRDGSVRWFEHRGRIVRDRRGRAVALEGILRDRTTRREFERSRKLLQAAVESAGDAVIITDADGRIEYVNPAFERITGYALREVRGETPRILKSGRQPDPFYDRMWRRLEAGRTFYGDFVNRRKDGTLYQQEATITPVMDERGRPTHYVGVARDVTEKRLLEEQFGHAREAEVLGYVAGGIAHDCRNVLGVIQAHTELALEAVCEQRPPGVYLEEVLEAVNRGTQILNALLNLGWKPELEVTRTSMRDLILGMRSTLTALFSDGVEVALEVEEDLYVEVDPEAIDQIVLNLATNARDAMPDGGRFTVHLRRAAGGPGVPGGAGDKGCRWVQLEISDTGAGMDGETLRKVFQPLFSTKPRGHGTGLGMTMVGRLVESNGGKVAIDSAPGEGTRVRLSFPEC